MMRRANVSNGRQCMKLWKVRQHDRHNGYSEQHAQRDSHKVWQRLQTRCPRFVDMSQSNIKYPSCGQQSQQGNLPRCWLISHWADTTWQAARSWSALCSIGSWRWRLVWYASTFTGTPTTTSVSGPVECHPCNGCRSPCSIVQSSAPALDADTN